MVSCGGGIIVLAEFLDLWPPTVPFKFPLNPAVNPTTIQKTGIISGNT